MDCQPKPIGLQAAVHISECDGLYLLLAPTDESVPSNSTVKCIPSGVERTKPAKPDAFAKRPVPPVNLYSPVAVVGELNEPATVPKS